MRDVWTVFRFTLRDGLRKKAFIITTAIVLVVILVACMIPALTSGGQSDEPQTPPTAAEPAEKSSVCYLLDRTGGLQGLKEALETANPTVDFQAIAAGDLDARKAEVEQHKTVSIVEIAPGDTLPAVTVYVTDILSGISADGVADVVKTVYVSELLAKAGVPEETAALALMPLSAQTVMLGKMDMTGYILGLALTMVVFFAVYYYGYGVAMSVASEKTSRVMETLIVSAKPSRILLGKCLGMGVIGLCQLGLFLLVGGAGFTLLVPKDFTVMGMPLALSSFTVTSALLVLVYFLLGYALYAMLNSVCGATVSRAEDLNSAMMPVVLVSLISFYAAYATMFLPSEGIKRLVTYIPFTSPFVMPFRLLNEQVPAMDILISLALLLVSIVLVAAVSVRIYTASVLHYGQRLKLKDAMKLKT